MFALATALFAVTTALGVGVAALQADPAVRTGALAGTLTAALAGALALALLWLTVDKALKQVLAALAGGMLCRMLMVAAGLLIARQLGGELISFAAGFFALYLAHQLIEITLVARRSRTRPAEGPKA